MKKPTTLNNNIMFHSQRIFQSIITFCHDAATSSCLQMKATHVGGPTNASPTPLLASYGGCDIFDHGIGPSHGFGLGLFALLHLLTKGLVLFQLALDGLVTLLGGFLGLRNGLSHGLELLYHDGHLLWGHIARLQDVGRVNLE